MPLVSADLFSASPFPKVNWGSVVTERLEKTTDNSFEPLSVGKKGVTKQLESVAKAKDQSGRKIVRKGDIVINSRSDRRGASGISPREGAVSIVYSVMQPKLEVLSPGYAAFLLQSEVFQDTFYLAGVGIVDDLWSTNFNRMSSIRIPLPPLPTQRAIADYLDRETAEIDGMRADLDEMERLLTERRSSIVSETMLHLALDHPRVQVGALVGLISGSGFPHKYQGQTGKQFPFYKVGSISLANPQGFIRDDRNTISKDDSHQLGAHIIPANSVLMAKIGAALLLGRFVRNEKPCCIDNNMLALLPNNNVDSKFLMLALSLVDIALLERPGPVPTLDLVGLRQNRIPLPPLTEQRRIADEIDRETAEIDSMLEGITELRDLLVERRAAVISAAVTGQIDIPVSPTPKDEAHA